MKKKICLVTPGHIASNPRIVKEADALHEAGYDVTVIYTETSEEVKVLDLTILNKSDWKYKKVKLGSKWKRGCRKAVNKISRFVTDIKIPNAYFARISQNTFSNLLNKIVMDHEADLYIGHNLPSLPIVYNAAKKYSAKYGFDAEDYHKGEGIDIKEYLLRDYIESEYLPGASYLTTSSPLINEKYYLDYHVQMETILNVFPIEDNTELDSRSDKKTFSLYWFSQTIGPGRGLEEILLIVSKMKSKPYVYLRGSADVDKNFINHLKILSSQYGIEDKIIILKSSSPDSMIKLASQHDIGLSIELNKPLNRSICLTNKVFTYLLAGIPVILSNTKAQNEIYQNINDAAILIELNNPVDSARMIDEVLLNKQLLNKMKNASKQYSVNKYNWNIEKKKFLSIIEKTIN